MAKTPPVNAPGTGQTPVWTLVEAARDLWLEAKLVIDPEQPDRPKNPAKFAAEGCGLNEAEVRGLAQRFHWEAQAKAHTGKFKDRESDWLLELQADAIDGLIAGIREARRDIIENGNYYKGIRAIFTAVQGARLMAGESTERKEMALGEMSTDDLKMLSQLLHDSAGANAS